VTGIDEYVWTAYASVDNFFDTNESVQYYHEEIHDVYRPDPIAAGRIDANKPLLKPREYFLKVFEIRIQDVTKEWHRIVRKLEKAVEEYVLVPYSLAVSMDASHFGLPIPLGYHSLLRQLMHCQ
jgi:hypothetical protein